MGRKRGGTVLMALGVVLALISGAVVFFISQTATAAPVETKMVDVVLARTEIKERTRITADMVQVAKLPEGVGPSTPKRKVEDVVGQWARENIHQGTPLLEVSLAVTPETLAVAPPVAEKGAGPSPIGGGQPAKPKLVDAAYTLKPGQTMVAVDYPEASKLVAAGILQPGNKVDIYVKAPGLTSDQMALIYSNVEIKAIGDLTKTTEALPSATLIFVVEPQQALVLKYLESLNPFLLIRAAGDDQVIRTDLVTMDYIVSRFGLQRPAPK